MKHTKHTLILLLAFFIAAGALLPAAYVSDAETPDESGYEEWQSESDGYSEDPVSVRVIIEGAGSVEIRIADGETWQSIDNGETVDAVRADSIEIKGIEGCWLSAAYGETEAEAKSSPAATLSEEAGGNTSVGIDNEGYVYIKVSSSEDGVSGNAAEGNEDKNGNVSWDEVSDSQADAGSARSSSVYSKGQKFYGKATAVSRVLRNGGSTITFRHDNGWIRNETRVKNITAVCISGHTRGLAYVGAVFNYVATVKEVSGSRIKIQVVYYPRKNKPNTWYNGVMASKAQIMSKTLWVTQYVHTGFVRLQKKAAASDVDYLSECPRNYTIKDAVYYLYTDSSCTSRAKDTEGNYVVLTTDEKGMTNTAEVDLEGDSRTFWAREITASRGYKYDTAVQSVTVTTGNTESDPAVISSAEPPAAGAPDLKVYKLDPTGRYGWNKLRGAEYRISYYDVTDKEDIDSTEPKRSWSFRTAKIEGDGVKDGPYAGFDWSGDEALEGSDAFYVENGKRVIPCGWFTIQEVRAPSGLAVDHTVVYGKVYQPSNGSAAEVSIENAGSGSGGSIEVAVKDSPQAVKIVINKTDASTGKNHARESKEDHSSSRLAGFSSLAGAEYEVYYDDNDLSSPELVGVIITDKNGYGELSERTLGDGRMRGERLAVGYYIIKEVKAAPGFVTDGYVFKDGTQKTRGKESIEVICSYEEGTKTVKKTIDGEYSEGSHAFRTRAETENTDVFTYTVSSEDEAVRLYVSKKDITTGNELPGAKLQIISLNEEDRDTVVEEWISSDKEHLVWELPAGRYLLREITAPYGYDVAEDIEFEIKEGVIEHRIEMKNRPVHISTQASSGEDSTHHGLRSDSEIIRDKVNISGLYADRVYRLTGCVVSRDTGEVLRDADGNEIRAEKEFKAAGSTVEIGLEFTIDSSAFEKGASIVCFERLYRGGDEIAKHEDLSDEGQTIHYGGIVSTMALDKNARSKNIAAGRDAVITDYVEYKDLSPEETYTLEAALYDRTEGSLTDIRTVSGFTPPAADGTTAVEIGFDAREMEGHDIVVFEKLYLNGRLIDEHEDAEDAAQTVRIRASSPLTGDADRMMLYVTLAATSLTALLLLKVSRMKTGA